jgi:hypothetical protein
MPFGHFGRVEKTFTNRSKSVKKAFRTVRKRSGVKKKRSRVETTVRSSFLLNLAKLIDFGFGVDISTIKRIQYYIMLYHFESYSLYIYICIYISDYINLYIFISYYIIGHP